jgi:hypothetical protein
MCSPEPARRKGCDSTAENAEWNELPVVDVLIRANTTDVSRPLAALSY